MHTTRPPTHRSRSLQPVPTGSVLPVSADWDPWYERLADARVLPEQFFGPQASPCTICPEAALMRAVFEDALACVQRQFVTEERRVQRLAREAEEWFFSDDSYWLFSFVSICATLGLEPEPIRQGLKRWHQSRPNMLQRKLQHVIVARQPPSLAA